MARRPRQMTKGATVKTRMGAARTTPLCLRSIQGKVEIRVGFWACNVLVREHQASGARRVSKPAVSRLGSSSLVGGKTRESTITAPESGKNRRCQLVGSLVGHLGLQFPLLETPVRGSLGLYCRLAGTSGFGSKMRVRPRGFSPRVLLTRWWKLERSRPHSTRKRDQHRRCQPVGSLVQHLGLQCLSLGTPVLGTSGL